MKKQIKDLVRNYLEENPQEMRSVPVSGKVYDHRELENLVEASLEGWWTEGRWNQEFEKKLRDFLGMGFCLTVNSGSSANLLALKTLSSTKLGERRINRGDEVITVAAGFPTTVNAIIEAGALPVFVDIDLGTYNAKIEEIEEAVTEKTKAIFLAHTLGNPFEIGKVKALCQKHRLWLIEDNCDALGSQYDGQYTGTFGDLSTLSFYPAHHITTAEGGAVLTNNPLLYKTARSIRDWGRDCWCSTGKDNTCGKRFGCQLGELPFGYDHKYTYSEIGYNLKMTDLQAAIGVAQMDKLPGFIKKRKENFNYLYDKMRKLEDYFILPKATKNSSPAWFGFLLTIKDDKLDRTEFLKYLTEKGIGTRLLFGGNITKQPYFRSNPDVNRGEERKEDSKGGYSFGRSDDIGAKPQSGASEAGVRCFVEGKISYKQIGNLENSDRVMNNTFWVGVYPGLKKQHLDYIGKAFQEYISMPTPL